MSEPDEVALEGGNATAGVVRVGDTVRRPAGPWTATIHRLLSHLQAKGFNGAPRALGFDEQGREILEFVPGQVPWPAGHRRLLGPDEALNQVGALLRRYHEAVRDFEQHAGDVWQLPEMAGDALVWAQDESDLIVCHNDVGAWNLVLSPGRWVLIDWDLAGPRPVIWDLAYCAIGTVPVARGAPHAGWDGAVPVVPRLLALAEGYGLSGHDRQRLPAVITARARSMYEFLRMQAEAGNHPWSRLWQEGHGQAWLEMSAFAEENQARWSRLLLAATQDR